MAIDLSESQFIGIDLAPSAIAAGQALVTNLNLSNIHLECGDVTALNRAGLGYFDYIIAHGLYSWVPEPVRKSILTTCSEMLTPQGIAYISYNAYPGNHMCDLVRGLMRFQTANLTDAQEKVRRARSVLRSLADSPAEPSTYRAILRAELSRVMKSRDDVFFHDDLSDVNQPFYLFEFVQETERFGLQFLGEASPGILNLSDYTAKTRARLTELENASEIDREQYKDFLTGNGFRRTLVCREQIALSASLDSEAVSRLFVSCDAQPLVPVGDSVTFRLPDQSEFTTAHALVAAGLRYICSNWPCAVRFEEVLSEARASLGKTDPGTVNDHARQLAEALLAAFKAGVVYLHTVPPKVVNKVSEKPLCSRLARLQIEQGDTATNQRHQTLPFTDEISRALVRLLDGTRDFDDLIRSLEQLRPPPSADQKTFRKQIQEALQNLIRLAMLVE
jgi:methyltransferase-like protein